MTAGAANFERTVDIFARREERLRKAFGRTSKPGGEMTARELKAKNISALLERVRKLHFDSRHGTFPLQHSLL